MREQPAAVTQGFWGHSKQQAWLKPTCVFTTKMQADSQGQGEGEEYKSHWLSMLWLHICGGPATTGRKEGVF